MFKLPKTISYGAAVLAAGALLLSLPRAAHAIAATLVQVTNTAAGPAVVQDVSRLASQQVMLVAPAGEMSPGLNQYMSPVDGRGIVSPATFSVPAGQSLILTSIDITPSVAGSGTNVVSIGSTVPGYTVESFIVTNGATTVLQFPNGIVFPAGEALIVSNAFSSNGFVTVAAHGYLTSN